MTVTARVDTNSLDDRVAKAANVIGDLLHEELALRWQLDRPGRDEGRPALRRSRAQVRHRLAAAAEQMCDLMREVSAIEAAAEQMCDLMREVSAIEAGA